MNQSRQDKIQQQHNQLENCRYISTLLEQAQSNRLKPHSLLWTVVWDCLWIRSRNSVKFTQCCTNLFKSQWKKNEKPRKQEVTKPFFIIIYICFCDRIPGKRPYFQVAETFFSQKEPRPNPNQRHRQYKKWKVTPNYFKEWIHGYGMLFSKRYWKVQTIV